MPRRLCQRFHAIEKIGGKAASRQGPDRAAGVVRLLYALGLRQGLFDVLQAAPQRLLNLGGVHRPLVRIGTSDVNEKDVGVVGRARKHGEQVACSVGAVDRRDEQDARQTAALHLGRRIHDGDIEGPEAEPLRPQAVQQIDGLRAANPNNGDAAPGP